MNEQQYIETQVQHHIGCPCGICSGVGSVVCTIRHNPDYKGPETEESVAKEEETLP